MAEDERKTELIAALARGRSQITANAHLLGHDLDFAARARRSFARNPTVWIGGTVVLGLVVARLLWPKRKLAVTRKTKEPEIEKVGQAGLLLGALKIAFDIARPILIPWATRLVTERFSPEKNREYSSR